MLQKDQRPPLQTDQAWIEDIKILALASYRDHELSERTSFFISHQKIRFGADLSF